jgi:hypothetical protein
MKLAMGVGPVLARSTFHAAIAVRPGDTACASALAPGLLRGREQLDRAARDLQVGLPGDRCAFGSAHGGFNPSSQTDAAVCRRS